MDEQMLLAAAMLNAGARDALLQLGEDDFTSHATKTIAAVIRDMHRRGDDIGPETVGGALEAIGQLARCGGRVGLHEMCSILPTATNADWYAHRVRQATRLRLLQEANARMGRWLHAEEGINSLDEMLTERTKLESQIPGPLDVEDLSASTVRALLGKSFGPDVWLLPGVMLRGDRLVLTGGEGSGKAWLMRQVAACAAAGVHPFTGVPFGEGYRALVLDCENGEKEMQESFARLACCLPDNGWQDRVFSFSRESGVDLTRTDAGWLHQKAAAVSPDLIAIGPAYKIMYGRDAQKDTDVLDLLTVLDDVRVRHNASLIVEHHAPHGQGLGERSTRPYGSSYWRRWATVGLGLKPHDMRDEGYDKPFGMPEWKDRPEYLDVDRWRFMRGQKHWPHVLRKGGPRELPWTPYPDDEYRAKENYAA